MADPRVRRKGLILRLLLSSETDFPVPNPSMARARRIGRGMYMAKRVRGS